jgi:sulfate transport system ATP-binding protein
MHIEAKNLSKRFGSFEASKNISFGIEQGKLIGLLGPSGSGKTTVLRMLAGLEQPDSGDIYFHGQLVNNKTPQERGIGFVFQNYALFRHMTVFDNIAFGLTVQKKKKEEIQQRVRSLIELTGLKGLDNRLPHQLSGGQRQRVAFARALAPEPQLLLLDEPFAAIDAKVRKELRTWLKEMIREVGITSIFVTHDQEEAVEVADEIIIMDHGQVEQQGTPMDIYRTPNTSFVAGFIGESSTLEHFTGLKGFTNALPHAKAIIRPEWIEIGRDREISHESATERGIVRSIVFRGASWLIEVELENYRLSAYRSFEKESLQLGEEVHVLIHRAYQYNEHEANVIENNLKDDPMPVYI